MDRLRARLRGEYLDGLIDPPPADADRRYRILITPLAGQGGDTAARHIRDRLQGFPGLVTDLARRPVSPSGGDTARPAFLSMSIDLGRRQLVRHGADLLVWGEVLPSGGYRVRLLAAEPSLSPRLATIGALDKLELPPLFSDGHGHVLAACALAALPVQHPAEQTRRADLLGRILPAAADFVESALSGSVSETASTLTAQGTLLTLAGIIDANAPLLDRAADTFRSVLILSEDAFAPHEKGVILAHLGDACAMAGDLRGDAAAYAAAAEAYRAARDLFPARDLTEERAGIDARLGLVLHDLARMGDDSAVISDAAQAFTAAAEVWSKDRVPGHWADIQNSLGGLLHSLAERRRTTAPLEQAEKVLRRVLDTPALADDALVQAVTRANLAFVLAARGADATAEAEAAARSFEAMALPVPAREVRKLLDAGTALL